MPSGGLFFLRALVCNWRHLQQIAVLYFHLPDEGMGHCVPYAAHHSEILNGAVVLPQNAETRQPRNL